MSALAVVVELIVWGGAGALAGSFPAALVLGRLWGVDVRQEGSTNPGTANVYRLAGPVPAVLTFFVDAGVGAASVLLPRALGASLAAASVCAIGAVAGRAWSPLLGGRGGRAQAIILTSALCLVPWAAFAVLAVYAVGAALRLLALTGLVNLVVLAVGCVVVYGTPWAVSYGVTVATIGILRRLQGSPDGEPYSLWERLMFDRERPP